MLKFKKTEIINLCKALKQTDKVTLVGDHGVYIMESWVEGRKGTGIICYAEGCDPKKDEDFYDNKVAEFGGDDGADEVGTVGELLRIANASKTFIEVKLTTKQIKITSGKT